MSDYASANVPVIAVDGPGGSGKGTISTRLAAHLGWHFLDSGALYRLTALAVMKNQVSPPLATTALPVPTARA